MSVIWSGVTEEGAVVPVQVDETGKVIATSSVTGDYVKKTGDNMSGNLTFGENITLDAASGSADFESNVVVGDTPWTGDLGAAITFNRNSGLGGYLQATADSSKGAVIFRGRNAGSTDSTIDIKAEGTVLIGGVIPSSPNISLNANGSSEFAGGVQSNKFFFSVIDSAVSNPSNYNAVLVDYLGTQTAKIKADGSATFAGQNCGFTSAGELFFSSRNERYRLVVQGELCVAEPYTREMELREKAEQIADNRETKPSDPQGGVSMDIDNSSLNQD